MKKYSNEKIAQMMFELHLMAKLFNGSLLNDEQWDESITDEVNSMIEQLRNEPK